MDHSEAQDLLSQFLRCDLDSNRRHALREHLEQCAECQAWRVITESLRALSAEDGEVDLPDAHPSSGLLAEYSLAPEGLPERRKRLCAEHLTLCSDCAQQARLVREAVGQSRVQAPEGASVVWPLFGVSSRPALRLALAATLVVAALAWLLPTLLPQGADGGALSGAVIEGEQTVASTGSLVVEDTVVNFGAAVVFEGGETVAFGNGFSVSSGARLMVVTRARDRDNDESSTS